jgi:hypothetical protein
MQLNKYDRDGSFNDPIVRCCDCQAIISRETIRDAGCCPQCGNRRVRNVLAMNEEEMDKLKENNIDPEFIALFEGVEKKGL